MNGVLTLKGGKVRKTALQTANSFVFSRERYAARRQCTDIFRSTFSEMALGTSSRVRRAWVGTTRMVSPACSPSETDSER